VRHSDRQDFAALMMGLSESYGEAVSEARMEIYFAALSDLELDAIRRAATAHVQTGKFFPRVSELRESIQGSVEDTAELAWVGLLRLVRRHGYMSPPKEWADPAMKRAAMELYGGWGALCENLPSEGIGFTVAAKQFKATYAAYARREQHTLLPASTVRELTGG
jgi:hypothetical protein